MRTGTGALGASLFFLAALAPAQPAAVDGKYDLVRLKDGRTLRGLLMQETEEAISLEVIRRVAGRPTIHFQTTIPLAEIQELLKLSAKERETLTAQVRLLRGMTLEQRLQGLELKPAFLLVLGTESKTIERRKALSYFSDHFELTSNAPEEIVRRAAWQLEQVYAAFTHFFPPVSRTAKTNTTTTIVLLQSVKEYRDYRGRNVFNPAFYDAAHNEVYAAADLHELGQRWQTWRQHQLEERQRIQRQERDLLQLPKGEVLEQGRQQVEEARRELALAAERNEELFRQATRSLFHSLYHEAFHAYLASFVWPSDKGEVPRWLNEGLAQVFETTIGEGNVLHIGRVDPGRSALARALADQGQLVPLPELLRATAAPFILAHGRDRQMAERYYLTAWGLTHYLLFGRRVLNGTTLQGYLTALHGMGDPPLGNRKKTADPLEALEQLAGLSLPRLEKEFHQYLRQLSPAREP